MIKNAEQIRAEATVNDVIGKYVSLKRRGVTFVGLCPFHNENSPSFTVFPSTNTWKCFGCGLGGDAISFLMEKEGMTYPEALEAAAAEAKIEIEYDNRERRAEDLDRARQEKAHRQALAETLHNVHRYYVNQGPLQELCGPPHPDGAEPLVDADGRLLKRSTADTFGLCISPDDNLIHKSGFWEQQPLEEIGILGKGEYGHYDFFRRRLLFRITDHLGKVRSLVA